MVHSGSEKITSQQSAQVLVEIDKTTIRWIEWGVTSLWVICLNDVECDGIQKPLWNAVESALRSRGCRCTGSGGAARHKRVGCELLRGEHGHNLVWNRWPATYTERS